MEQNMYQVIKFSQAYKVGIIIFPSLQMRKLTWEKLINLFKVTQLT